MNQSIYIIAYTLLTSSVLCGICIAADPTMEPVPTEISAGEKEIEETRRLLQRLAYKANYVVKAFTQLQATGAADLSNVPLPEPAQSTGRLSLARDGDKQLVIVQPDVVAPAHANHSFAAPSVYQQEENTVRVFSESDNTLRIDARGGVQAIHPAPRHLILIDNIFRFDLIPDWPAKYAGLSRANIELARTRATMSRSVRTLDQGRVEVNEEYTVPFLMTATGPIRVRRIVEYDPKMAWLPVRLTKTLQDRKQFVFELKWVELAAPTGKTWLPQQLVSSRYFPVSNKPGAEHVLMEVQTLSIDPDTVLVGDQVEPGLLLYEFPKDAKVFRLNPKPKGAAGHLEDSNHASQSSSFRILFPTALTVAVVLCIASALRLTTRLRRGNRQ